MNYYSTVVLLSRRAQYRLRHSRVRAERSLLSDLLGFVYLGRTCDPHQRAKQWRREQGNSLGASLRRLEALGYKQGKDYLTAARVWFRFKGAKNTPQSAWDLPESAFKILCARDPFKLHDQNVESLCDRASGLQVTTRDVCIRWSHKTCTKNAWKLIKKAMCSP